MSRFQATVVTFDHPDARASDPEQGVDVLRAPRSSIPRVSNSMLNAFALREAYRLHPELTLSGHIVGSPAAAVLARFGIPFVQYLHGDEVPERPRLSKFAVTRAAANIAVSGYTGELAIEAGADPAHLHHIPPGVDLPASRRAERSSRPTVVTVARLTDRYKGHDVMIRALARIRASVPDARWIVIGDGPLRAELIELARVHGVSDSVVFTGWLSDSERDAWLDRAHVFAMPSRLPPRGRGGEGFGIVYLEAAAHTLPVVAGNVGGASDAVIDGATGLLVDPTNAEAVADAIVELLLDRGKADSLGSAGAARAGKFAWPQIAAQVEDVLLSTAETPRA